MNVLLVSPATPDTFWSFRHALRFLSKKAAYPPLGLMTVAGMLPRDWSLTLIDLNVGRLTDADLDRADYVLISAMIVQSDSAHQVVARCLERGKPVIAGGPLFTTGRDRFPEVQHVVLGEAENLMPQLVEDMVSGQVQAVYQDPGKPDVTRTPIPRWDLINFDDYVTMPVQFSRGCPFNCEFCDIIVMYGRAVRVKTPAQLIGELDSLIDAGWRGPVFIVDDNFIGNKKRVAVLLREMIAWRRRRSVKFVFTTEASLNLAESPELLDLMVQAGFKKVFIGIETPEEDSLVECAKVQNAGHDLVGAVRTVQNAGLEVLGGFIVGFDNDKASIFDRQWRFIQESGVVTAMVGLLTALPETRLYTRLQREGRLLRETTGNNLDAVLNFIPKLDRRLLIDEYRLLVKRLYAPDHYYRRALTFLREYHPRGPRFQVSSADLRAFVRSLWVMGVRTPGRREYWKFLAKTLLFHRQAFGEAVSLAILGHHYRKIAAAL